MKEPPTIDVNQAAALAEMTAQGVVVLSKSQDPPPKVGTQYPAGEFGKWLKRRHLRGVGVDSNGVRYDYESERARLVKSQADKAELEAKVFAGELIVGDQVESHWVNLITNAKTRLLAIPTKIAPQARGAENDEQTARLIEAELLEILQELENDDGVPKGARKVRTGSEESVEAPTQVDSEPVGGPVPKAKPGKRGRARKVAD